MQPGVSVDAGPAGVLCCPMPEITSQPDPPVWDVDADWWGPTWDVVTAVGVAEPAPPGEPGDHAATVAAGQAVPVPVPPHVAAADPSWGRTLAATISLWIARRRSGPRPARGPGVAVVPGGSSSPRSWPSFASRRGWLGFGRVGGARAAAVGRDARRRAGGRRGRRGRPGRGPRPRLLGTLGAAGREAVAGSRPLRAGHLAGLAVGRPADPQTGLADDPGHRGARPRS